MIELKLAGSLKYSFAKAFQGSLRTFLQSGEKSRKASKRKEQSLKILSGVDG
jgi:hypothetical protein